MEIYNEEEQVQQIKNWLREYGPTIVITVLVVVIAVFGWRYWTYTKEKTSVNASVRYEQLLISMNGNDTDATDSLATELMTQYQNTPYAKLAALLQAKAAVEKKNYITAKKKLQWVIEKAETSALQQVARNRLARIYLAENKPKQAIELLKKINDKAYLPAVNVIRGDSYMALKELAKARKYYKAALDGLPKNAANAQLLQMKYNAINVTKEESA